LQLKDNIKLFYSYSAFVNLQGIASVMFILSNILERFAFLFMLMA